MDRHFIRELKKEIPLLISGKVIDEQTARRLEAYYGGYDRKSRKGLALTILGSLAALLIGSGIILIFAYNWHRIATPVKTGLSSIPLLTGQVLVFHSLRKGKSRAWIEFSAILLSMAVGSQMALISQIYHIPGNPGDFLLTWMLLILPVLYLTDSTGVLLIYLTGALFWCGYSQAAGQQAIWYWLLYGAVLPRHSGLIRKEPASNRTAFLTWMMIINLLAGTGISLEKALPGLWILIYSLLLSFFRIAGNLFGDANRGGLHNPLLLTGKTGTVLLAYIFSFRFFWNDIGLDNIRKNWSPYEAAAYFDYAFFILLLVLTLYLFYKALSRNSGYARDPYLAIFPLALMGFSLSSVGNITLIQIIMFNGYTLFIGGWLIARGIMENLLYKVNLGMLTVLLIIMTRFFDMEIGFTEKGLVFIGLGIVFLLVNRFLGRRFKDE